VKTKMGGPRKILFLSGTRADFGKLKPLIQELKSSPHFEVHIFVTGMHMLSKYGYTCEEVERLGITKLYKFINQNSNDGMDQVLAKTILGLSDYVREIKPDFLVVHGDRVEALAGATVGALNNILTGHIEGGEISGTIDELLRHAITKLSHVHFVANQSARSRLIQLGEIESTIHVVGSPDIDVMNSQNLPSLEEVRLHYQIPYQNYSILALHPVTTELTKLREQVEILLDALIKSNRNYVVIYPNNDHGTELILDEYNKVISSHPKFKIFPSMRFEYFITLLRHADFIIGNSSSGVRESPHFGVPCINLGTRQNRRVKSALVIDCEFIVNSIGSSINKALEIQRIPEYTFGNGNASSHFKKILLNESFWHQSKQKYFVDRTLP
jgi:UDP-N-acetylglucosamine 2-epimerase (hydrolysing)